MPHLDPPSARSVQLAVASDGDNASRVIVVDATRFPFLSCSLKDQGSSCSTTETRDEGKKLYQDLEQADATQEQTRASHLPAAVTAFYVKKGELYAALKIINSAGHELHADDPQSSAHYNLSILHRHGGQAAAQPTPTPPAPAQSTARA